MENEFSAKLIEWYGHNKRDLPWRNTTEAYPIWISEVIMQQTRIQQGLPYYERFLERFNSVTALASAPIEEVLRLWQGLGYYSRARNMHSAANQVVEDFGGIFPDKYEELKKLKGVGNYTAAAIASFAYGEAVAVVDGNVFRFLSRYTGNETPINTPQGTKVFEKLAADFISRKHPAEFNQAIMEFGALQCRPRQPLCESCIFCMECVARQNGTQHSLPVKLKKLPSRIRYFNYLQAYDTGIYYLNKRKSKDIWEGLYDFPLFETNQQLNPEEFSTHLELHKLCNGYDVVLHNVSRLPRHVLSHQVIFASIWKITVGNEVIPGSESFAVKENELNGYPLPRLITRYLEETKNLEETRFLKETKNLEETRFLKEN